MAIDEGAGFTQPRQGPKAFTQYSFNAILVLVGLIGSFFAIMGSTPIYLLLLAFGPLIPMFGVSMLAGVIGVLTIPLGILQIYYAWKIHNENFPDFQRVRNISWLTILLSIASAVFSGILFLVTLQILLGIIVLNALVIFFLGQETVQAEFVWNSEGYE
jgi:hypothetical protein